MDKKTKIEWRRVDDVTPYENNPRNNEDAVQAVAKSIEEFGFQQPLVVDSDGVLVVGHTRLRAAKSLGMKEVPVVVASELTEEQVRAYRLADNRTNELAQWDFDLLSDELEALSDSFDMSDFGFEQADFGGDIVFMDFDGDGDGGGSRMADGKYVRIVLGPFICDMLDEDRKYYSKCAELDEEKVKKVVRSLFDEGVLP